MLVALYATNLFTISDPRRILVVHITPKKRVLKNTYIRVTFGLKGTVKTCVKNLTLDKKCHCPTLTNMPFTLVKFVLFLIFCGGFRTGCWIFRFFYMYLSTDVGWAQWLVGALGCIGVLLLYMFAVKLTSYKSSMCCAVRGDSSGLYKGA